MSRRPRIAMPLRVATEDSRAPFLRNNRSYVLALEAAGALPLLIPPLVSAEVGELLELADGVLLTGGPDVEPSWYGEKRSPEWPVAVDPELDVLERQMALWALEGGHPVLGVCRGVQLLNVVAGGSLYQDLPAQRPDLLRHDVREQGRAHRAHAVSIAEGSQLAGVVGAASWEVNSLHHQGLRELAPGWKAVAWSPDGLVEGVERDGPYALGVQWHPEELLEGESLDARALALFGSLVEASRPEARAKVNAA